MDKVRIFLAGIGMAMILAGIFNEPITIMRSTVIEPRTWSVRLGLIAVGAGLVAACAASEYCRRRLRLRDATSLLVTAVLGLLTTVLCGTVVWWSAPILPSLLETPLAGEWSGSLAFAGAESHPVRLIFDDLDPRIGRLKIDEVNGSCLFRLRARREGGPFALTPDDGNPGRCRGEDELSVRPDGTATLTLTLSWAGETKAHGIVTRVGATTTG